MKYWKTNHFSKSVCYKQKFVITKFVITEFDCIIKNNMKLNLEISIYFVLC